MTTLGDILRQIRRPGEQTGYFAKRGAQNQGFFTTDNDLPLPQDRDVWFTLNPATDGGRGRATRETVTRLSALHADLDIGGAGKTIPDMAAAQGIVTDLSTMLGTPPIAIIGSGHGYQPIWAIEVTQGVAGDEAGELLRRWGALVRMTAENYGGDVDSVFELARLVRAPGTVNYKHTPVAATATMLGGRPLGLAEIRTTLDAYSPAPEPAAIGAASGTYTGPAPTEASTYEINAVNAEIDRLKALPRPWHDGANWDATTFAVATSLTEIANANWSVLTHDDVERIIEQYAPYDSAWDERKAKLDSGRRKAGSKGRPAPNMLTRGPDFITAIAQQQGVLDAVGAPAQPPSAPPQPSGRGWSDVDNGMRVYDATQGKLLWLADAGTWAEWRDSSWETGIDLADDIAQAVLRKAAIDERSAFSMMDQKTYDKLTASTGAAGGIRAAAVSLKRSRLCTAKLADFDQRPDLLRTPNGVINLRDGALLAPSPEMRLLKGTSVAYDPHAQATEFDRWLKWAQPDQATRDYLQMAIGIALTGEQVKRYWVHEGAADAGKSMLIKLMTRVLGDAAVPISDSLIEGRSKVFGDDYHRAALRGARLAVLDETRQGGHTLETSIKQLVGGATMVGRNPAERPFQFEPVFKLHIATNNAPINSPDPAIRNRLALVRWEVGSTEADRRGAIARLGMPLDTWLIRNELPGILAWAVRGAARWYASGMTLETPAAVSRATDEHMAAGDLVAQWLREETYEKEGGSFQARIGWRSFKAWKESTGERGGPETETAWGIDMKRILAADPSMSKGAENGRMVYRGRVIAALNWIQGPPSGF